MAWQYCRVWRSPTSAGFRTTCFIECLQIIERVGFNKEQALAVTADLRRRMKKIPAMLLNQPEEVEVLSYEALWEIGEIALSN